MNLRRTRNVFKAWIATGLLVMSTATVQAGADCYCRFPDGENRSLGTVECVKITGRQYLMRCEMSNNTPYWKRLDNKEGCPVAAIQF